jgi:hypothetical protein
MLRASSECRRANCGDYQDDVDTLYIRLKRKRSPLGRDDSFVFDY